MPFSPHIVFVEQYYYPEGWGGAQIPRDITIAYVDAGYRVSVYCSREQYVTAGSSSAADPTSFGVSITHIPRIVWPFRRGKKIVSQIWFCVLAFIAIALRSRPSAYVAQTNPPLIVVALALVSAIRRRPFVIIAQDLYPEVLIANKMLAPSGVRARVLTFTFRWAYRRAVQVVSLGPKMSLRLQEKGIERTRIQEISNWATGDLAVVKGPQNELRRAWGLAGKFVLLYSGNFGIAHDAETIFRGLALALPAAPEIHLVVVGGGARIRAAQQLVNVLGISEAVSFESPVRADLMPHSFGCADLALVSLLPEFSGLVVPSKLLGHMARGVPTLYVGPLDSDVALVLAHSGGGVSFANGDVFKLEACIRELSRDRKQIENMGERAATYYRKHLTQKIGSRLYQRMMNEVLTDAGVS